MIDEVLAQTVYATVQHQLRSAEQLESSGLTFRIKTFARSEIRAFLEHWKKSATADGFGSVRVVVAGEDLDDLPSEFHAEKGRSVTWYRNNITSALVYVEVEEQSDEQGLKQIYTIRDSSLLDGTLNQDGSASGSSVTEALLTAAWERIAGRTTPTPQRLFKLLQEVLNFIHPSLMSVPLRRFTRFAIQTLRVYHTRQQALDDAQLGALVGEHFPLLDLFQDDRWRSGQDRLLEMNIRHADQISGATELQAEALAQKALTHRFRSSTGTELPPQEVARLQAACARLCRGLQDAGDRAAIPYFIIEQLFAADSKGLKLGQRIREAIGAQDEGRLAEFDATSLEPRLDVRSAEAIQAFLELEPDHHELLPLRDLVGDKLQKVLNRLAEPSYETFDNPMLKLAELASELADVERASVLDVAMEGSEWTATAGLFAFLYGPTLLAVQQASTTGLGLKLRVAPDLTAPRELPSPDPVDGAQGEPLDWADLHLTVRLLDDTGQPLDSDRMLRWSVGSTDRLALWWLLVQHEGDQFREARHMRFVAAETFEHWLVTCRQSGRLDAGLEFVPLNEEVPLVQQLNEARSQYIRELRQKGVCRETLESWYGAWLEVAGRTRHEFVPNGLRPPELITTLAFDLIELEGGRRALMLPSHPLRARWLSAYLGQGEQHLIAALAGELQLNSRNPQMYLDWLQRLSPREQPSTAWTPNSGTLLYSTGESGWCEDFGQLNEGVDMMSVDRASIGEIVRQIDTYLQAHPYKRNGLSLLFVRPQNPALPAHVIQQLTRSEWQDLRLTVHVAVERRQFEEVASAIETLSVDGELNQAGVLPQLALHLHDLTADQQLDAHLSAHGIDVGIVADLLHARALPQHNTEPADLGNGSFNPLLDRPTQVFGGENGGAISIALRPRNPDPALDTWATLTVRAERTSPVSAQQHFNTDYAEIRISFSESAALFSQLHEICNWVITLERYITRQQIEALEGRPDILTVKEGVGSNELFTLIVSSNAGRPLVVQRLLRRLESIVDDLPVHARRAREQLVGLAHRIYDETRLLSPRLALQAMGTSRITEEILGLMIARGVALTHFPALTPPILQVWVSLDEYPDWFSGASGIRADLCRLTFWDDGTGLQMDVLVVEGKLREKYDAHGVKQVEETLELFRGFLDPNRPGGPADDAQLWREKVIRAVESTSPEARQTPSAATDTEVTALSKGVLQAFRAGQFTLRSLEGLYSICLTSPDAAQSLIRTGDVTILRSTRIELLSLIERPSYQPDDILTGAGPEVQAQLGSVDPEPASGPQQGSEEQGPGDAGSETPQLRTRGRLTAPVMAARYQRILDTFAEFNVLVQPVRPEDGPFVEGPASVLFRVLPADGVDPRKLYERGDALKLALKLDQDQAVAFQIDRGHVTVDVPKAQEERYYVAADELWTTWQRPEGELAVPLGEDRFGRPVVLNFSSPNSAHLLIGGTTGSGKSEALNTLLHGLTLFYSADELRLLLVDPKGTELLAFEEKEHLLGPIGWDDADAQSLLSRCVDEMQDRYVRFRERGVRTLASYNAAVEAGDRLSWWVVVLDEYADLTSDPVQKKEIEQMLKRLAQKARAAGIHVVIATQKPSADVISTTLRANLSAQLALRVRSATESRVVIDEGGAETLNGRGDALLRDGAGVIRLQCARVAAP